MRSSARDRKHSEEPNKNSGSKNTMTALKMNSVSLADLTKQKKRTRNSKTEYLKLSSQSRKRKKKSLWDTTGKSIHTLWELQREYKEKVLIIYLRKLWLKISQVWASKWIFRFMKPKGLMMVESKKYKSRHIVTEYSKFKDKDRILKIAREEHHIQGNLYKNIIRFLSRDLIDQERME